MDISFRNPTKVFLNGFFFLSKRQQNTADTHKKANKGFISPTSENIFTEILLWRNFKTNDFYQLREYDSSIFHSLMRNPRDNKLIIRNTLKFLK